MLGILQIASARKLLHLFYGGRNTGHEAVGLAQMSWLVVGSMLVLSDLLALHSYDLVSKAPC